MRRYSDDTEQLVFLRTPDDETALEILSDWGFDVEEIDGETIRVSTPFTRVDMSRVELLAFVDGLRFSKEQLIGTGTPESPYRPQKWG